VTSLPEQPDIRQDVEQVLAEHFGQTDARIDQQGRERPITKIDQSLTDLSLVAANEEMYDLHRAFAQTERMMRRYVQMIFQQFLFPQIERISQHAKKT
jgi:uncharacterized membrane protein YgaE (UPF0421/DUF939 family)